MSLTKRQQSKLLRRLEGEDATLEQRVFSLMRSVGLRFTTDGNDDLPGPPSAVFRGARVAIFIESDFWHGWQFTRWRNKVDAATQAKIEGTRERDARIQSRLRYDGWKVLRVWEHQVTADPVATIGRIQRDVSARSKRRSRRKK